MESSGARTVASMKAHRGRATSDDDHDDGCTIEEKSGGAEAIASSSSSSMPLPLPPRRPRVAFLANGCPVDGVQRADVMEYYTHRDGSIYRCTDYLSRLYRAHDTNETGLKPMMRSEPSDYCSPNWRACERHTHCTMMQIFSLKLAYPPRDRDPVQVYGFMAVRDTRDHLRNYIFNRTRDDPFIVEQEDGFIQLTGPKRGIWWYDKQLVEFDMRIKRGENEADDLQLIDGAFWVYDRISPHARVLTQRIDGDYGSVDISYALLQLAMEAMVQIAVSELDGDISLLARAFYVSDLLHQGMQLFDGVIPAAAAAGGGGGRYELDKYVAAASRHTKLALQLRIRSLDDDDDDDAWRYCLSPASTHGTDDFSFALGFATIDVKISWSTLD